MESSHRMNIIWFFERIKNKNLHFLFMSSWLEAVNVGLGFQGACEHGPNKHAHKVFSIAV